MFPRFNAIVDADVAARAGLSVPALARAYLAGGVRFLQLRAKQASGRVLLAWADEIAAEARRHDALLVVNDRVDIALMAGVRAVHVGQDDVPVDAARRLLGPEAIVGLSTHTRAQIDEALRQPIAYLAVGPIFGTRTKETGYEAVGLDLVRYAAARARALHDGIEGGVISGGPISGGAISGGVTSDGAVSGGVVSDGVVPIVAIGGITLATAPSVIAAGAATVAVITDLVSGGAPAERAAEYVRLLGRV